MDPSIAGASAASPTPSVPTRSRLRAAILLGYRLEDRLPEGVEMATQAVADLRRSGLGLDLVIDEATSSNLRRIAAQGADLLFFYGHGSEDGHLAFSDSSYSYDDLVATPELERFWKSLKACFVFACFGDRFATKLPCSWVAFSAPVLTTAPRGFLHALIQALTRKNLTGAIDEAREQCRREMHPAEEEPHGRPDASPTVGTAIRSGCRGSWPTYPRGWLRSSGLALVGQAAMSELACAYGTGRVGNRRPCACGSQARFKAVHGRQVTDLYGGVLQLQRAYQGILPQAPCRRRLFHRRSYIPALPRHPWMS